MPKRPWVKPAVIKAYTEKASVKDRNDEKLKIDISRAEQYVINYTKNRFEEVELPEPVKTAVILLAEMYADAALTENAGQYKSETFDDYSYTAADTASRIESLNIGSLIDEFVVSARSCVNMKLRKL